LHRHRYTLSLISLIVVLGIVRWPALQLPYFRDELGVYSQAALHLYDHDPSLLPGSVDTDLISLEPSDLASRFYRGVYFLFFDQGRYWILLVFVFWRFNTDYDLSYQIPLRTLQRGIDFLEATTEGIDGVKVCAGFPAINALRDERQGYVSEQRYVVTTAMDASVDFVIEMTPGENPDVSDLDRLNRIFEFESYYSRIRIYEMLRCVKYSP